MAPLPGVHRVRVTLASGRAEYWYAWRGGPKILSESASTARLLDLKVKAAAGEAGRRYHEEHERRVEPVKGTIAGLVQQWKASEAFKAQGERTKADARKHLDVIVADLGDMRIRALEARRARKVLLDWRLRYKATPRTADHYMDALAKMLVWARDEGHTSADPLRRWKRLYSVDRSEIVWKAEEIEAVCAQAEPELQLAILLAAYSGLRQGDLLTLTWSSIGPKAITRRTRKKGRVVDVPITRTLRKILALCDQGSPYLLTKDGAPWKASTLAKRFSLARAAAAKACPSIKGKRWHDFRGTYATELARSGVDDAKIDQIMGWKPGSSSVTRASYVAGDVVAHLAIARLAKAA